MVNLQAEILSVKLIALEFGFSHFLLDAHSEKDLKSSKFSWILFMNILWEGTSFRAYQMVDDVIRTFMYCVWRA